MNLVLTGFMGTGKTTIGQIVAHRLGLDFVDMDALIEQQAGSSISEIFSRDGEPVFRQMERALCEALAAQTGLVIATGGGALVDPANRSLMTRSGMVICLTARPDVLLQRLSTDTARPLLELAEPSQRIRELLAARDAAYSALPYHLDTSTLTPEQTAEAVIALWQKQCT